MEFGRLLRLVCLTNLISCPISIQERYPTYVISSKSSLMLACIWTVADLFLSNLVLWWRSLNSNFDSRLDDLDIHARKGVTMRRTKTSGLKFLQTCLSIWMKFNVLSQPAGLVKLMLNWFHTFDSQGRGLNLCDFINCTFNIGLFWDICELISFKLGVVLNTTKLHSMI